MKIYRDQYLNALIEKKDNGRVKIVTGIRRCGKSYLLSKLYKNYLLENGVKEDQIIELALDEIENIRYRNPFELNSYIKEKIDDKSKRYYVFIDEIQLCAEVRNPYVDNANEKVTFVDTVLGLMKIEGVDIYVTGSNSKMLSSDILTQFRDRGDEIQVFPLSFSEFYPAYKELHSGMKSPMSFPFSISEFSEENAWTEYCTYGGMPYVLSLASNEEKSKYLKKLIEETYIKDIIERNAIRNEKEVLNVLLDFVSSAIGSLTNPLKLENRFSSEKKIKISHNTIAKYLEYFEEAFILNCAKRYDIKGSKYFNTPLKYYLSDMGLRNARLNFRQYEEPHIMENIIYNDLIRRGYNVDVGVVEYLVSKKDNNGKESRSRNQLEVDFVVNHGNKRYYIQSALHLDDPHKKERETNSLKRIKDSFKKIVVVRDKIIPWYDDNGIFYIGIQEFLLNENAIEQH
ncbi:MAG: ATP-binding protein [Kiritimatiellae bacterium]|nr:ATP-binding protein [Kiritimatiellia bacterium]